MICDFHIPTAPAEVALVMFVAQCNVPSVYLQSDVNGVWLNAIDGTFDPEAALRMLVEGTSLVILYRHAARPAFTLKTTVHPVRINGHDYDCVPLTWIIGMAYPRHISLAYDLGLIDRHMAYCTNERAIDPTLEPDGGEESQVEITIAPTHIGGARAPSWGPRR